VKEGGGIAVNPKNQADTVENIATVFSRRLREVRNDRGITMGALAERVNAISDRSWTSGTVAKAEGLGRGSTDTRTATIDDLVVLARALNVSPQFLALPPDEHAEVMVGGETYLVNHLREWWRGQMPLDVDQPLVPGFPHDMEDTAAWAAFDEQRPQVEQIAERRAPGTRRLVELVNLLVLVIGTEDEELRYSADEVNELVADIADQAQAVGRGYSTGSKSRRRR
jgi:transcriptional regulator with XRE-family HTH domain